MNDINFYWPAGKASAIMVADNAIDEDICSLTLSELKKYYSKLASPGPTIGGIVPSIKNTMDINWSHGDLVGLGIPSDKLDVCEDNISKQIFVCVEKYREEFRWLWDWMTISDSGFRVQEYQKGFGYYREHIDGGLSDGPQTNTRVLAVIVYLNTVEIGGETLFREHGIKVPAKAGSICVFPTHWTYPHQACLPISGDKWIISTFILNISEPIQNDIIEKKDIVSVKKMPETK